MERFEMILNILPLEVSNDSYKDSIVNSETLNFSFNTKFPPKTVNCFINNSAFLEKENKKDNKVLLKVKNLKQRIRYRINCTHIDQNGQIYWFGKMIKRQN